MSFTTMRMAGKTNVEGSKSGFLDYSETVKDAESVEGAKQSVSVIGSLAEVNGESGVFVDSKGMAWVSLKQACQKMEEENSKFGFASTQEVDNSTIIKTKPLQEAADTKSVDMDNQVYDMASIRNSAVEKRLRAHESYISGAMRNNRDLQKKVDQNGDDCLTIANLVNAHHDVLSSCTTDMRKNSQDTLKFQQQTKKNMEILSREVENTKLELEQNMKKFNEKMLTMKSSNSNSSKDSETFSKLQKTVFENTQSKMDDLNLRMKKLEKEYSSVFMNENNIHEKIARFNKR